MDINKEKILVFLNEKYAPLAKPKKIGIAAVATLLPILIFVVFFHIPVKEEIMRENKEIKSLQKDVNKRKGTAATVEGLREELANLQMIFDIEALKLPKEQEMPQLLKDISALGRNAGLDIQSFKPLAEKEQGDFYSVLPISVKVKGPYHQVGYFFSEINKLDRIVSVANVNLSSPQREGNKMLLSSECQLATYRFTNKKLNKKTEKK